MTVPPSARARVAGRSRARLGLTVRRSTDAPSSRPLLRQGRMNEYAPGSTCQLRCRSGPEISPSARDVELVTGDRHLRRPEVLHVVAVVVLPAAQRQGVADLGGRADGVGDHHVDLAVLGIGLGGQLGAAADVGAVPDRDHQHRLVEVGDDLTVDLDVHVHARGVERRERGADRVAELAEVRLADADRAEALLPAGAAAAGLGTRADVHVVDHDLAELVDDEVHRPHLARDDRPAPPPRGPAGCPGCGRSRCPCPSAAGRPRRPSGRACGTAPR